MIRFHGQVRELLEDAEGIRPDPDNYNNGDVDAIVESIVVNGVYRPVICSQDGTIIAGHHLYAALLELGSAKIPVLRIDVEPGTVEAKRIMIADNQIASLARPDTAQLVDLLADIKEHDKGLMGTGFTDLSYGDLLGSIEIADHDFFGGPVPGEEGLNTCTCQTCDVALVCPECGEEP